MSQQSISLYDRWSAERERRRRLQRVLDRLALQVDVRTWRDRSPELAVRFIAKEPTR